MRLPCEQCGNCRWMTGFAETPRAVLFDRDGTLVVDVPYNGDPELVRPIPGAREVVSRLRMRGVRIGVITNQSGVARGLITGDQVAATNQRIDDELGPFDAWFVCPHGADDGCRCRKPQPGMVFDAAARFGLEPHQLAVIGDIGADVDAARAAGARGALVPTAATRGEEIEAAELVADDLAGAVELLFGARDLDRRHRLVEPVETTPPDLEQHHRTVDQA